MKSKAIKSLSTNLKIFLIYEEELDCTMHNDFQVVETIAHSSESGLVIGTGVGFMQGTCRTNINNE